MPSNPTYPRPFGLTWDEREHVGRRSRAEYDEPIELPLHRRWPAVAIASALILALGAGLLLIERSTSRGSLRPTEELPMTPREFEPSLGQNPVWSQALSNPAAAPAPAAASARPVVPAPQEGAEQGSEPRQTNPPPDREPPTVTPVPEAAPTEREQRRGFDFGSPETLRPPDSPALDPNDLSPKEDSGETAARPANDDMPDADVPDGDVPDADIPDGDVPDADGPDAEPPAPGSPDYSPILGF
jgi:hypothetical protein